MVKLSFFPGPFYLRSQYSQYLAFFKLYCQVENVGPAVSEILNTDRQTYILPHFCEGHIKCSLHILACVLLLSLG